MAASSVKIAFNAQGFRSVVGYEQSHIIINFNQNVFLVNFLGNSVPDNQENAKICLCPGCPTYQKSKLTSNIFCARGKAKETVQSNGCLCPNCAVFKNYALDQMYYCVLGKSADIK